MQSFLVVPSTTSHKHEPLALTLEIFAKLGMRDLDLNLNHLVDGGVPVDDVRQALAANGQRVWIASGGWCDFFHADPQIADTFASVERQIAMARAFGADRLRLFFGRLPREEYSARARDIIVANMQRLADRHRDMLFVFENHDGASSLPDVCREVLDDVDRSNVRLTFDPMNFEHADVDCSEARATLQPLIGHVHLKGYDKSGYCEFGEGDVDLTPVLRALIAEGYRGAFTVEYEGSFDRTSRLYRSFHRAQSTIEGLAAAFR